jgi:SAM-dependent methyltransferase
VKAVERVASHYAPSGEGTPAQKTRFHYVRIKLLGDAVARLIADIEGDKSGVLGEVLDIGTGAGQLPILLLELGRATKVRGFDWDEVKVESARKAGAEAREPGGGERRAEFFQGDAREAALGEADTVMLIDLLHYFRIEEQDAILKRAAAAVRPGGRILVREADTEQGWRSGVTLLEERVFTTLRFNRGERVRFRPAREVIAILEGLGFSCRKVPAWGKTPFSNVLIVGSRPGGESK